jgi:hypothetical protein
VNNISVYTSCFNLSASFFDLEDAFSNWGIYANEICIASMDTGDNTFQILKGYEGKKFNNAKVKVIYTDFKLEDYAFDGKLKNAALQACSNKFCIQQDLDERIGGMPNAWDILSEISLKNNIPAFFIPVINLYKSKEYYSGISQKWYFHKKDGCYRGVVNFAKLNDKIDIERSDTCELIDKDGNLIPSADIYNGASNSDKINLFKNGNPYIIHLGYLDLQKREKQNQFWKPVWENRKGGEVKISNIEKEYFKHGLNL